MPSRLDVSASPVLGTQVACRFSCRLRATAFLTLRNGKSATTVRLPSVTRTLKARTLSSVRFTLGTKARRRVKRASSSSLTLRYTVPGGSSLRRVTVVP